MCMFRSSLFFSELPFITQVISQVLKNGPPAIAPHGECSGAQRVRSLQDTLSALSVSHGIEGEGALVSMIS